MKKELKLTEHYLIPLALAAANFCLAHLFYLFAIHQSIELGEITGVAFLMTIIMAGIFMKNKFLLISSVIFYTITLIISLT